MRPILDHPNLFLLIVLGLLFVMFPLIDEMEGGHLILSFLFSLVMLAAVYAAGQHRRFLVLAAVLAVFAIVLRWTSHFRPDLVGPTAFLTVGLALLLLCMVGLLRFILRAPRVDSEVLSAAVAVYLLLVVAWTLAYWIVALWSPNAFVFGNTAGVTRMDEFNAFYFSLITLTTLGYGDITPASHLARMLAGMEAMVGMLYVAVLIARLVSLYSAEPKKSDF